MKNIIILTFFLCSLCRVHAASNKDLINSLQDLNEASLMQPLLSGDSCLVNNEDLNISQNPTQNIPTETTILNISKEFDQSLCGSNGLRESMTIVYQPCKQIWGIDKIGSAEAYAVQAQLLIERNSGLSDGGPSEVCKDSQELLAEILVLRQKERVEVKIEGASLQVKTPQGYRSYPYPPKTEKEKEQVEMWIGLESLSIEEVNAKILTKLNGVKTLLPSLIEQQEMMRVNFDKCGVKPANNNRLRESRDRFDKLLNRSIDSLRNTLEKI